MSDNNAKHNEGFSMGDVVRVAGIGYFPGLYEIVGECDAYLFGEDVFGYDFYITGDFAESEIKVKREDLILVCRAKDRQDL